MTVQTTNKSAKGKLLIAATLLITLVVWLTATPAVSITALDRARHVIGGLSLSSLFMVFLLSARSKTIEKWFNGLDRVYVYHKYLAIASVVAIVVHAALSELVTTLSMPGASGLSIMDLVNLQMAQTGDVATPVVTPALASAYVAAILFALLTLISLFNHSLKHDMAHHSPPDADRVSVRFRSRLPVQQIHFDAVSARWAYGQVAPPSWGSPACPIYSSTSAGRSGTGETSQPSRGWDLM